eukprot:SM000036S13334  [mRNA]  locus=s36:602546:605711:- [translate_table: standard]
MADFESSSQRQRWLLPAAELEARRAACNERAVESLHKASISLCQAGSLTAARGCKVLWRAFRRLSAQRLGKRCGAQYGTTKKELPPDGSNAEEMPMEESARAAAVDTSGPLPEALTVEEEVLILRYYEHKIQQVCGAFNFPNKIQATAIMYLKRFYLRWSTMEHDPKHIMLTCVYLACKVEEFHVSAEEFGKGIQQDPQVVLKNELTVLQGLCFELIIYAPYRSLEGLLLDHEASTTGLELTLSAEKLQASTLYSCSFAASYMAGELSQAGRFVADKIMLTDAPLMYSPGKLAVAALWSSCRELGMSGIEKYLKSLIGRRKEGPQVSDYMANVDAIVLQVAGVAKVDEGEVRRIDRKLKYCRNPSLFQDEPARRGKKDKNRTKRSSHDMSDHRDASAGEDSALPQAKRRQSADVMLS